MSTQDTTATEEVVDTSTNEEAQDTGSDLENSDISFDDAEDDSEEDETEESEESDDDESANESDDETEEESEDDEGQEAKADNSKADADKKRHNDEMAKKRIAEREAKRKSIREAQEKYVADGEDAHDIALRQLKVDAYNNKVNRNNDHLQNSMDKAIAHIDLFKSDSPEIQEALLEAIDDFEAMNVVKDEYGNYVEVNGDLFEHLQRKADSIRRLTGVGERKSFQDKAKTKSRTLKTPSRTPKQPKSDPLMDGFDEEAERW